MILSAAPLPVLSPLLLFLCAACGQLLTSSLLRVLELHGRAITNTPEVLLVRVLMAPCLAGH